MIDTMIPGTNGWPTSAAVAAELRRQDPAGHGSMKHMSYTPGTGEPQSAAAIAQHMLEAQKTATTMSSGGIFATRELAEEHVDLYRSNPDYVIEVRIVETGPKAGQWWGNVTHRQWVGK